MALDKHVQLKATFNLKKNDSTKQNDNYKSINHWKSGFTLLKKFQIANSKVHYLYMHVSGYRKTQKDTPKKSLAL